MEPELIADSACVCGENPLWHPFERRIYWVDIPAGRLFRFDPRTGLSEVCFQAEEAIGGFTIQADGALLLFMARGAVKRWKDGTPTAVLEGIPEERGTRFNDVIADPAGRVYCGTMATSERPGRLYRLDVDGSVTLLLEGVECPNGLGFTLDRKQVYFTDSGKREIYLFDYDAVSGELSNRRLFFRNEKGSPDGMTVDEQGFVWSAIWGGNCLIRLTPDGIEERRFLFPAEKVSSVIFGGDDYKDLYVTTAGGNQKDTDGAGAGALFRIRGGIAGMPEFLSRVLL